MSRTLLAINGHHVTLFSGGTIEGGPTMGIQIDDDIRNASRMGRGEALELVKAIEAFWGRDFRRRVIDVGAEP